MNPLANGPFPQSDGWGGLYAFFDRVAPARSALRRVICGHLQPRMWERSGGLYRALGVRVFGRFVPTGGVTIRRLTGARMTPYTLASTTTSSAREFYYRTCVFEALHLPFLITLLLLAAHRASIGRWDLAFENTVVNLVANVYPVMHHRNTRARIANLLHRTERDP